MVSLKLGSKRIIKTYLSRKPPFSSSWFLLISTALLTLFSTAFWQNWMELSEALPAVKKGVFAKHEYWRLITGFLVHSDMKHFLSNMGPLLVLGHFTYGYFQTRLYPVWLVLLGALINALTVWGYPENVRLVGASGVVYLLAGYWLGLYMFLERRHSIGGRIIRVTGFTLMMLFPTTFEPNVSYSAHFIGLALGLMWAPITFLRGREFFRSFEIYEEEDPPEPSAITFH